MNAAEFQQSLESLAEVYGLELRVEYDSEHGFAVWGWSPDTEADADRDIIGSGDTASEALDAARRQLQRWWSDAQEAVAAEQAIRDQELRDADEDLRVEAALDDWRRMKRAPYSYAADLQERAARAAQWAREWREFGDEVMAVATQHASDKLYEQARSNGKGKQQ